MSSTWKNLLQVVYLVLLNIRLDSPFVYYAKYLIMQLRNVKVSFEQQQKYYHFNFFRQSFKV